jgi:hypothetical protein
VGALPDYMKSQGNRAQDPRARASASVVAGRREGGEKLGLWPCHLQAVAVGAIAPDWLDTTPGLAASASTSTCIGCVATFGL